VAIVDLNEKKVIECSNLQMKEEIMSLIWHIEEAFTPINVKHI
jgi:hypothetical protein